MTTSLLHDEECEPESVAEMPSRQEAVSCPHCGVQMRPYTTPWGAHGWLCLGCVAVHVLHRKESYAKGF